VSVEEHAAKIRALIVDDEPLARSNLAVLLRVDPEIGSVSECGSGAEAIGEIRVAKPDLLFLDVQMPECDGFDVLEMLGKDLPPAIVFVTAYDQYALRAFEAGALDYLLKPFDNARFELALGRAKQRIRMGVNQPKKLERFVIKNAGQLSFVKISEIDWIEAADYYACLHVGGKSHLLRRSMSELEEDLDAAMFCRVHRSSIVNLERVRGLKLSEDGEYEILLENGARVRLSRRYRKQLQERMGIRSEVPSGSESLRLLSQSLGQPCSGDGLHLLSRFLQGDLFHFLFRWRLRGGFGLYGVRRVFIAGCGLSLVFFQVVAFFLVTFQLVVFFGAFEIVFKPLRAGDTGGSDRVTIDHHIGDVIRLKIGIAEVVAGGLQGIEHEACGLMIDFAGAEHLDDLHERDLDRVGVFEQRKIEALCRSIGSDFRPLAANLVMEKAMPPTAQCGRAALGAVGLHMLTSWNIF
jgi:two-component system LytT family response regulator